MTVGDAIQQLQGLDPHSELVDQNGKEITHIVQQARPNCSLFYPDYRMAAVVWTKNPFPTPVSRSNPC